MMEVVRQLQFKGHIVEFYIRKDGGILIKRIDNVRYTKGASGNQAARSILGVTLSEARQSQLKYATRARRVKRPKLDDEVYNEWSRVKKKWNKAFKSKHGKPHPAGYFGWARIKYTLDHYGREEALRRIHEAEKYTSGLAYDKNVQYLIGFIRDAAAKYGSEELTKLADDVEASAYLIKEEWIKPSYDMLYELNHGIPPQEVAKNLRAILRL